VGSVSAQIRLEQGRESIVSTTYQAGESFKVGDIRYRQMVAVKAGETKVVSSTNSQKTVRCGPDKQKKIVAVMEIVDDAGSMSVKDLSNATNILRGRLAATNCFVVIDKTRQEERLSRIMMEGKLSSRDACIDESCQIPLGRALAADSILRATVACLGEHCELSVELVDLEKEAAVTGAVADFNNGIEGLPGAIRNVTSEMATVQSGR